MVANPTQQDRLPNSPSYLGDGNNSSGSSDKTVNDQLLLKVETTTWTRDSHDLYDYETPHVNSKKFFLKDSGRMFRKGIEVHLIEDEQTPPDSSDFLLSVRNKGKYHVCPADRGTFSATIQPKKLWLVVRELEPAAYPLQYGDVIKLGRFKLRVKQVVKEGDSLPELRLDDNEIPASSGCDVIVDKEVTQCRICLYEGSSDEDPLVSPCQCKGSIKYVHIGCLRHWVNGRLNPQVDDNMATFFYKQLQCELCKFTFPSAVMHNGSRLPIVSVPVTKPPFIVLENFVGASNRGIHILSMANQKTHKLGRGHESDVRIPDVSISRCHATIRFNNGKFLVEDQNSKFGTLIALRKPFVVESPNKLAIQVGRTIVNFSLSSNEAENTSFECLRTLPSLGDESPQEEDKTNRMFESLGKQPGDCQDHNNNNISYEDSFSQYQTRCGNPEYNLRNFQASDCICEHPRGRGVGIRLTSSRMCSCHCLKDSSGSSTPLRFYASRRVSRAPLVCLVNHRRRV